MLQSKSSPLARRAEGPEFFVFVLQTENQKPLDSRGLAAARMTTMVTGQLRESDSPFTGRETAAISPTGLSPPADLRAPPRRRVRPELAGRRSCDRCD